MLIDGNKNYIFFKTQKMFDISPEQVHEVWLGGDSRAPEMPEADRNVHAAGAHAIRAGACHRHDPVMIIVFCCLVLW